MDDAPSAAVRIRPWAEVPPERQAGLRGVLTDIDDTLTRDGAIEAAALEALHALADAGLPVIRRPAGPQKRARIL